jgi:hypothetical protein
MLYHSTTPADPLAKERILKPPEMVVQSPLGTSLLHHRLGFEMGREWIDDGVDLSLKNFL